MTMTLSSALHLDSPMLGVQREPMLHGERWRRLSMRGYTQKGRARVLTIAAVLGGRKDDEPRLSADEYFKSLVRQQQASSQTLSDVAGSLLADTEKYELDVETRQQVRELVQEKERRIQEVEGGFLKLGQAKEWVAGVETSRYTEGVRVNKSSARSRSYAGPTLGELSRAEYAELKDYLTSNTVNVAMVCIGYCAAVLTFESAVSYAVGALGGFVYLQMLFRHTDTVSKENVPEVFWRRERKTIGFTTSDLASSLEKFVRGTLLALSHRMLVPATLMALYGISRQIAGGDESVFHIELAPLICGLVCYKGAALMRVYKENQGLSFRWERSSDPKE